MFYHFLGDLNSRERNSSSEVILDKRKRRIQQKWFGITSDLFPGVTLPESDYTDLVGAIKEEMLESNLVPTEIFLKRSEHLNFPTA